jgi:hypothetical protein
MNKKVRAWAWLRLASYSSQQKYEKKKQDVLWVRAALSN